jgi:TonB family protein
MSMGEKLEGRTLVDIRRRNRAAADLQLRVWPEVPVSALKLLCMAILLVVVSTRGQTPPNTSFPKPIYSELPTYPERARYAHLVGSVKLWFMADNSGAVTQAGIISGHPIFSDAALGVVKSWKFQSGAIKPNVRYESEFAYDLKSQSQPGEPNLTVSMTDLRRVEVVSEIYTPTIY